MTEQFKEGRLPQRFSLKPIKAAKVSEISEAVSSSSAPPEERVNFHIGNPVTEPMLTSLFGEIVFQQQESSCNKEISRLIKKAIRKSVPYAPRGGYKRNQPNSLALLVHRWLSEKQQEPLDYDLGQDSGKREIIFQSGGTLEALRVFFRSVSRYLYNLPAEIITWGFAVPEYLTDEPGLNFSTISDSESHWLDSLSAGLSSEKSRPVFMILGKILKEKERRELRRICLNFDIFVVEVNNAPNHLSIAREAGLIDRVIRLLEPEAIHPTLANLSIIFTVGNSAFLEVMESVHFELKGTPSTSEMILTSFLAEPFIQTDGNVPETEDGLENIDPDFSDDDNLNSGLKSASEKLADHSSKACGAYLSSLDDHLNNVSVRIAEYEEKLTSAVSKRTQQLDPFQTIDVPELSNRFLREFSETEFIEQMLSAFTVAFTGVHPEYDPSDCFIVSGSARTALSILGYHCGISEVITPDLGWTYHHCFPRVTTVPLGPGLTLDKAAILELIQRKIENNQDWKESGAVILNSPHNASGKVYSGKELKALLKKLLPQKIKVIDDLSYENIHPRPDLKGGSTLRQLTNELIETGELRPEHGDYLITVHSLSKTDCFAGARLAVAEIRLVELKNRFDSILQNVAPNLFAIFIAYLFYRNGKEAVGKFWLMRNRVFTLRMKALEEAADDFPEARNLYGLHIIPPEGSMYPRLEISKLPQGLSLEWLSTGLAARGIGLVPLSTFSRTEKGYELARKSFRLSLGGADSHKLLKGKMRKVLIDLNRIIAAESSQYSSHYLKKSVLKTEAIKFNTLLSRLKETLKSAAQDEFDRMKHSCREFDLNSPSAKARWQEHLEDRINSILCRLEDKLLLKEQMLVAVRRDNGKALADLLEQEFYRDSLASRETRFKERLSDRTVHPTQMYSLAVDMLSAELEQMIVRSDSWSKELIQKLAHEIVREFTGHTVAISSREEADEVICDLNSMIHAEEWAWWMHGKELPTLLSFWGDWDGSTRPSGQGHRLVASVLQENIISMAELVEVLAREDSSASFSPSLLGDIQRFRKEKRRFRLLLDNITDLTHQLEKRYQGLLPDQMQTGFVRKIGMVLRVTSDPITSIFEHNDRLERKMQSLKLKRRAQLDYFFSLNKRIRKALYANISHIRNNINVPETALLFGGYKDKLKRFVLTPRIHQKTISDLDSFTIDRTIQNIVELNDVSGRYGNPGMVMALQVSMSTEPEALIELDRKFRAEKNRISQKGPADHLPPIRLVPLFEEKEAVLSLESYLDKLWKYCETSRDMDQTTGTRFSQMICELFVAGSDLSQQLSQPAGAALYRQAKYTAMKWLAEKSLAEQVRIKLGSGEPMQRQGGYYDANSGKNTLFKPKSTETDFWMNQHLTESARKAMSYARSPLSGIMSGGEFRTLQSNVSEKLRHLSDHERADILYHIWKAKTKSEKAISRAAQTMMHTRLNSRTKEIKELERMTLGYQHPLTTKFTDLTSKYFRQILFGSEEDVVGIHAVSYFISRTTPPLRDRPVVRPVRHSGLNKSRQVVGHLKEMVPLARYGSMLRAIGHNRAQTVVMGVNQLTTGLFRSLSEILSGFTNQEEGRMVISDRILPILPVRDILHTLRIFHDQNLSYLTEMEDLFPSGSSAFHILREDHSAIRRFTGMLQRELVRKQGLKASELFDGDHIRPELIPLFRPDIAVLLQRDIFNTDSGLLLKDLQGPLNPSWEKQMRSLLNIPVRVQELRENIWSLIRKPIRQQVKSFVKVAAAVSMIAKRQENLQTGEPSSFPAIKEMTSSIKKSLKQESDESLQQFLFAAVHYLSGMAGQAGKMPVEVIRVLRDVKQILSIEEQALDSREQELFSFYLLEIARITGENG